MSCIYVIECAGYRKIGSSNDIKSRLRTLRMACPLPMIVEASVPCERDLLRRAEMATHWLLVEYRHSGEWFSVSKEAALSSINHALEWAKGDSANFYDLLGPEPNDEDGYWRWHKQYRLKRELIEKWNFSKRGGESMGRAASVKRRDLKWECARTIAEPLWAMPSYEWSAPQIVEELKKLGHRYSVKTLYNRLGTREDAQERRKK